MARDFYESGQYRRAGDYFTVLSGSDCSGDEGYFLYWAGRSYEAAGDPAKAYRAYRRILDRHRDQKDPSTGLAYAEQALTRGLVLAAVEGDPAEVRAFLEAGEALLDGRLEATDDEGRVLASAPGQGLGNYCLARALAEEGSLSAAKKALREGEPPAEGSFVEGDSVRSLAGAWAELARSLPEDG